MVSEMISQIAPRMVMVCVEGPEYGELTARPMPLPSAMKMKATAHAASAPAITTLHVKALRAEMAPVWMTSTLRPTIAVSLMAMLLGCSGNSGGLAPMLPQQR